MDYATELQQAEGRIGEQGMIVQIGRRKYNWGQLATDTWVIGMVDGEGDLPLEIIPDKRADTLILIIQRNVADSLQQLTNFGCTHSEQFVEDDRTHTEGIEGQWRALLEASAEKTDVKRGSCALPETALATRPLFYTNMRHLDQKSKYRVLSPILGAVRPKSDSFGLFCGLAGRFGKKSADDFHTSGTIFSTHRTEANMLYYARNKLRAQFQVHQTFGKRPPIQDASLMAKAIPQDL